VPKAQQVTGEAQVVPGEWAFEGAFPCWVDGAADARLWWADRLAPALHAASAEGDGMLAGFEHPIQALLPASDGVRVLAGEAWYFCGADGRRQAVAGRTGRTLFVTTAREAVDRESLEAAPLSGRLFVVQAG
jgi:hypothetical protein